MKDDIRRWCHEGWHDVMKHILKFLHHIRTTHDTFYLFSVIDNMVTFMTSLINTFWPIRTENSDEHHCVWTRLFIEEFSGIVSQLPDARACAWRLSLLQSSSTHTSFFFFLAPLMWPLISSTIDFLPDIVQNVSYFSQKGIKCEAETHIVSFVTESRSSLCGEIRLLSERHKILRRSREMNCREGKVSGHLHEAFKNTRLDDSNLFNGMKKFFKGFLRVLQWPS